MCICYIVSLGLIKGPSFKIGRLDGGYCFFRIIYRVFIINDLRIMFNSGYGNIHRCCQFIHCIKTVDLHGSGIEDNLFTRVVRIFEPVLNVDFVNVDLLEDSRNRHIGVDDCSFVNIITVCAAVPELPALEYGTSLERLLRHCFDCGSRQNISLHKDICLHTVFNRYESNRIADILKISLSSHIRSDRCFRSECFTVGQPALEYITGLSFRICRHLLSDCFAFFNFYGSVFGTVCHKGNGIYRNILRGNCCRPDDYIAELVLIAIFVKPALECISLAFFSNG